MRLMIEELLKDGGIMGPSNSIIKNIVYLDHTSTSIECPCKDDSNRPDGLLNIMRDNIIILQPEPHENIQNDKPAK